MQHHSHRKNQHIDSLSHISSSGPLKKMYELKSWRRRVRNLYRPNPWSDIHIRRIKDTMYEHRLTLQKIRKVKISTDEWGIKTEFQMLIAKYNKILTVNMISEKNHIDLNEWLRSIRKIYGNMLQKPSRILVALKAIEHTLGAERYEVVQICVGCHILLIRLTLQTVDQKYFQNFLKKFSQDKQFIFVGIGVEDILTNLSSQYRGFKMLSSVKTVDLWELAKKNRIYERVEGESIQACLAKNELSVYNQVPKNSRWQSDMDEKHASYKMAVAWASWEVFELEKIALSLHRVKWSPSDRF